MLPNDKVVSIVFLLPNVFDDLWLVQIYKCTSRANVNRWIKRTMHIIVCFDLCLTVTLKTLAHNFPLLISEPCNVSHCIDCKHGDVLQCVNCEPGLVVADNGTCRGGNSYCKSMKTIALEKNLVFHFLTLCHVDASHVAKEICAAIGYNGVSNIISMGWWKKDVTPVR